MQLIIQIDLSMTILYFNINALVLKERKFGLPHKIAFLIEFYSLWIY